MNRDLVSPKRLNMRAAKTSLRSRGVWSESSQGTRWAAKNSERLQKDNEDDIRACWSESSLHAHAIL